MGVTVDSSILIDLLRGARRPREAIAELEATGLVPVLSTVAVFEVLSGVEYTRSRSERARVEILLRQIPIEPFGLDAARRAGEFRAELMRTGRTPGVPDLMIAGHALAAGHTLLTRDKALAEAGTSLGLAVKLLS